MGNETNVENLLRENGNNTNIDKNTTVQDDLPDDISFCRYCQVQIKKSLPIGTMKILQNILVLVNFYFMGWFNDKYLIAGYGLTITAVVFFFTTPVANTAEVAGIYHSKHYGAKRYHKMFITYQRGFGISLLFQISGCLFYIRLDLILHSLGFSSDSVALAYVGAWTYVPYVVVSLCNENFKSLLITLGYEKLFYCTNFIQIAIGAPLSWLFIWHFQLQIIGSNIMFFVVEIVLSICYIWTYYNYPPEFVKKYREYKKSLKDEVSDAGVIEFDTNIIEYARTPGFSELYLCREFVEFSWFLVRNQASGYIEYFGFEMTTILCGLYGDINIINAWFIVKIWMAITFQLGNGFANSIRTFVGIKIGKKQFESAKKIGERGIYQNMLVLLPIFWTIALLSPYIALIFSHDKQIQEAIRISMTAYFIVAPLDCSLMTMITLLRFFNAILYLNLNSLFVAGGLPILLCSLGLFVFDWGNYTLAIEWSSMIITVFIILFTKIKFFVDWSKIQDDEFKNFKTNTDSNGFQEEKEDLLTER